MMAAHKIRLTSQEGGQLDYISNFGQQQSSRICMRIANPLRSIASTNRLDWGEARIKDLGAHPCELDRD